MVNQLVAVLFGDLVLKIFDALVHELDHLAVVDIHHMVVMFLAGKLIHGMAIVEVVSRDDTGGFELGEHPVDGGEAYGVIRIHQILVNVFGTQVVRVGVFQHFQHFQSWQCDLQTRAFDVRSRHLLSSQLIGNLAELCQRVQHRRYNARFALRKAWMWCQMADLKDKVVLVTDASHGLGRGIAAGLAEAGATVYLSVGEKPSGPDVAATRPDVAATVAAVEALGGRAIPLQVDGTDDEALLERFRRVESEAGRLDVLVNNALWVPDPSIRGGAFWEHPINVWDGQCGNRLRDCYVASALAARLMVAQGSGLIVNLSDTVEGDVRLRTARGVFNAGAGRMAADMAQELSSHGVTALSLDPGPVRMDASSDRQSNERRLRSPRFVGRALAALAMDPDIYEKTGEHFEIEALRGEYRFSELSELTDIAEASS